jgi:hypothetical protein
MSLSTAETYARRARDAKSHDDLTDSTYRALHEIIKAVKDLESDVSVLQSRVNHLR